MGFNNICKTSMTSKIFSCYQAFITYEYHLKTHFANFMLMLTFLIFVHKFDLMLMLVVLKFV